MKLLFVVLAVLAWTVGFAERINIVFNAGCGTSIEYDRLTDGDIPGTYFAHSLPLNQETRLLLESDAAGIRSLSDLPTNYLNCQTGSITSDLAERVNSGAVQLFLIEANDEGGYLEHPILMAALLTDDGSRITYSSPMVTLSFDKTEAVIGDKLSSSTGGNRIMFEGREGIDCASPYLLNQQSSDGAYSTIELKLYPGVGLIERKLTANDNTKGGGSIIASKINGQPVDDFLLGICQPQPEEADYSDQQRGFVPLYVESTPRLSTAPGAVQPRAVTESSTFVNPAPKIHTVSRGETLYGISRLHRIEVSEIKRLNDLNENTIFVGQVLKIGSGDRAPEMSSPINIPEVSYSAPNYPASPIRDQASYTADTGETLASIAYRSGYTKERFAEINGLDENAVIFAGQQLRTSHCDCETGISRPAPEPMLVEVPEAAPLPRPGDHIYYPPPPILVNVPDEEIEETSFVSPPAYGASPTYSDRPSGSLPSESRRVHVVKDGDNLYGIARQYRLSVSELRALNDLATDVIVPFQELYLN